ncbi:MAG: GDP-mannose 4,6-dehydratase [Acidocella sp.]|nr:GDP-mannose 4,6-dehydratase [Acidocella sp.]MDE8349913.1 GDP-mannose 4,6-dehydratase [Acidocella sp.]
MGFWQDKKVLVTGATGFLGGWVVRLLLEQGADIIAIVRRARPNSQFELAGFDRRVTVIPGAAEDSSVVASAFAEHELSAIFHLASMVDVNAALREPAAALRASIESTINLLEQIRLNQPNALMIVASSDKAYGMQPTPFQEDKPLEPRHPYEIAKATQDLIAQSYGRLFNLNVAITRCGNYFGGYDFAFERIIPYTIAQILRRQAPVLRSDGNFTRDFLYVEEAARVHVMLAEKLATDSNLRGQAFNFSYELDVPIIALVSQITHLMGSDLQPVIAATAQAEIKHMRLDTTKARTQLGWQPAIDFDAALARTVKWYSDNQLLEF